jgi:hypothetical protein
MLTETRLKIFPSLWSMFSSADLSLAAEKMCKINLSQGASGIIGDLLQAFLVSESPLYGH